MESKRVTIVESAASAARAARAASRSAAAPPSRGRTMSKRGKAMTAVAKGRASVAEAAAVSGAGTAVAPLPVSVAELPLFVYWTAPATTGRAQRVKMCPLGGDWKAAKDTDLSRVELENAITATASFCGTNVSDSYLERQLPHRVNPMLFVLSMSNIVIRKRGDSSAPESLGFILAREKDSGVYLDIICTAPKFGKLLLDFFHKYIFEHPEFDFVKLSSLANVLTLYPRFGYEFRKTCDGAPLTKLSSTLATRNFREKPAPVDTLAAYEDKDYMDFMYDTLYKATDLGVRAEENCKNRSIVLTREQYGSEKHDCAQDGFTMMLCRKGKAGGRRTRKNVNRR